MTIMTHNNKDTKYHPILLLLFVISGKNLVILKIIGFWKKKRHVNNNYQTIKANKLKKSFDHLLICGILEVWTMQLNPSIIIIQIRTQNLSKLQFT